jgi:hypothetical protein
MEVSGENARPQPGVPAEAAPVGQCSATAGGPAPPGGKAECQAARRGRHAADAAWATLVYLGLTLLAVPFWGWRLAPVLPALFLLAVAVFGRGEDIEHPARWAFIAACGDDSFSWLFTAIVLVVGVAACLVAPRRLDLSLVAE